MLFNLRFGGLIILCFAFFYLYCFYFRMSRINLQKSVLPDLDLIEGSVVYPDL